MQAHESNDKQMIKQEVAQKILNVGIVPVVRAASATQGMQAAEAVCAGGIPIVEMTMTVPGAIDLIAQLSKSMGSEVLIGAVLSRTPKLRSAASMPVLNSWLVPDSTWKP